jgi:hypothetical protein
MWRGVRGIATDILTSSRTRDVFPNDLVRGGRLVLPDLMKLYAAEPTSAST